MLQFDILDGSFSVCRLGPHDSIPDGLDGATRFFSITRTESELSIICASELAPVGISAETGFRILRVAGPLPFDAIGIVSSLTRPLADAKIPVLVVSTYETDYLLIRDSDLDDAVTALRGARITKADP